jgi:aspartyl-tRNA(Asn)/glutamyl-tRNA(Gln) amidotransferase subunit B
MNSFRNVERAINYEIERQEQVIRNGGEIIQTTLLWDANKMVTREMRSKEEAHDYRYFPEPDIPPIVVTDELLGEIRADLPEMPDVRRERFEKDFKLSDYDANLITEDRYFADFYEAILDHYNEPKAVANLVTSEVLRVLNELSVDIRSFAIDAKRLATLVKMKDDDKISSSAMQTIFNEMLSSEKEPEAIAEEKNLVQVSDTGFIEELVDDVIAKFPDKVEAYQSGKKGLMGFFIGQVMQNSKGQANPQMARKAIIDKIGE